MQTVKFVYSGSDKRKLTVMGRDQVIVSGDNNSTQFIFSFPDSYKDYSKEIIWSGFYIKDANDEEIIPRYPIINDTFYVPQEITLPNSGKEITFQIILTKPKDDEDESSFDIMETSLEFQVYVSKCAKFESVIASTDSLSLLLQKAYVSSAYDVDQEEDRPIITFSSLEGQTSQLILDMPYLDESGTIAQQFLPPGSEVKVWHVDYEQDIYDLTFSNPPDLAIIDVGIEGSQTDYAGNIFVKTDDENNTWVLIYSKYTTDQIQPIYDDIQAITDQADALEARVDTAEDDIDALEGRMDTAEGDIDTLESGKVDKTTTVNGHALSSDVTVTKADVGLGNADNTQDIDKPISTATQQALDQKLDDSQLVTSWSDPVSDTNIPSEKLTKDTLDNITGDISGHIQDKSNPHEVTKAQVGLGNVDNTSDLNKPISTATQSALDLKLDDSQLVTQWTSTVLDTNIPSEKLVSDSLDTKVDKVQGYGLSQNDLTDALKQQYDDYDTRLDTAEAKLDTIESGAEVNVQSDWAEASVSSDQYILNKPTLGTAQAQDYVQVSAGQGDQGKLIALNNDGVVDGSALPAFVSSVNTRAGAVTLTKSDVGLTNTDDGAKAPVDNLTSNTNPPLATTVQAQVNDKMNQLPSTLTGGKILVSIANDRGDIQESSYDTSKLGYLDNVTSDIQTQINNKVTANTQLQSGATKCKITYDTKGLVTAGQDLQQSDIPNLSATKITSDKFDKQRLPSGTGIIYEGSFTGDGVTSSWTYPVTPYDTNVASISIRDSNGYDVRFGVQYGIGVVTITSAEPLDNGQSFTFKLIAPVA